MDTEPIAAVAPPAVSVVLSTYNRCDLLGRALESLLTAVAETPPYEVIVVDNASTDDTPAVVESFRARSPIVRYVFEPKQGLSYGYNTGILEARAPLLAFTDDDIVVSSDWIANVKATFDAHPEADFIGGCVLPMWPQAPPAWLDRQHWAPLALQDVEAPYYSNGSTRRGVLGKCFRRDAFRRVGLFQPELGRIRDGIGSLEDRDLITRLWNAGRQGLYAPALVMHALVQRERLGKAYHRRWHSGHGRFYAMMKDDSFERTSCRLLGVPLHVYRALATQSARWMLTMGGSSEADVFMHELHVRFLLSFVAQRWRDLLGKTIQPPPVLGVNV